jgi:two-component system chemotaxis sensor kinase CheA
MSAAEDQELSKAFFVEAVDILDRVEGEIEQMAAKPQDKEIINAVFRGLHTIKGNSSFLSFEKITKLAHASETLLDKARKGDIPVTPELIGIVRHVFGELKVMIGEQEVNRDVQPIVYLIKK